MEPSLQERQRLLLDAVLGMAGDHTLDGVLDRIVRTAAVVAGARYAALGVLNPHAEAGSEHRLSAMIQYGLTPEEWAAIPRLPHGEGVLGALIDDPHPLRLHDVADHAASVGFPEGHPPMHSFLGTPVRIRDQVFGNLYLAEKLGAGDFTQDDEEVVVALAAAAAVAIENARLHEQAADRQRWLAAANVVVTSLGDSASPDALRVVAAYAREVAGADVAWAVIGDAPDDLSPPVVVPEGGLDDAALEQVSASTTRVLREQGPVADAEGLVVSLRTPESDPSLAGALGLVWHPRGPGDAKTPVRRPDAGLVAEFAEQAALALLLHAAREDGQRLALLEDRDRIARDLHDHVIQDLFAVGLGLKGVARRTDDATVSERLGRAASDLDATVRAIRRSIFDLAVVEGSQDVQSEVTALVERAHRTLKFLPTLQFSGPVRSLVAGELAADVLAVLAEALSNAARHALPSAVDVGLEVTPHHVRLRVADDGVGLPADAAESGLANIRARAERRGGDLAVSSVPGGGTILLWTVPLDRATRGPDRHR